MGSDPNMDDTSDLYKIGTVAGLTGIAVERLRAWERRYGLTPASREGKTRFYSSEQVERLTRIKHLIDQGHPVSTLINLSGEALTERLQAVASEAAQTGTDSTHHTPSVGLVGTQLLMLEQSNTSAARVNVAKRWVNLDVCLPDLDTATELPDVLVVLVGSVNPETLARLNALPAATQCLLVYHYGTNEGLELAAARNHPLLRWPVSWSDLEQGVARLARAPLKAGRHAPRHFSDEQLLTIASSLGTGSDSTPGCACPADLVNLISTLNAFTDHSGACAGPGGIAQPRHARIAEHTSNARLQLELVLDEWVSAEGLLPAPN